MAGAAEREQRPAGLPEATSPWATALRAQVLAWQPSAIAAGLTGAALGLHLALWGQSAPLGAAPLAGAALAAAGLAWALWAAALFLAAGNPLRASATPPQLIEEGPYKWGRHPMDLGTTVLMLGAALGLGVPLLAAAALLYVAWMDRLHIPHEEARLARRFGGWWRDYASVTRRWL